MDNGQIKDQIYKLKKDKNAVIVAHNYQTDDVQDVADMVGDSFALSRYCASSKADVIVFCGVHFMAESAKILAPDKTVLLPEIDAGCLMADMVTAEGLKELKKRYPDAAVVCYINSSADVKSESDVCCTSSNAVNVVKSLSNEEIIFVPDKNLGRYVGDRVPGKKMILWEGFCPTHYNIKADEVKAAKELHPDALLLVHPECRPEVTELADFVGSTKQIIDFASNSSSAGFIIGTEMGVLFKLKKDNPDKKFYLLTPRLLCSNMKKICLTSVRDSLENMKYIIELDESVVTGARQALEKMLLVG